ncbi:MAG TPA: hypothetical protein VM754_00060 [Actinomycetota bacterium]|nr:hypothetical protein [Actinomycetota bacterium]
MLIRAVGDIRQAQRRLDQSAATEAGRNLDRAIGIQPTEEEWRKRVKREQILGDQPSPETFPAKPVPPDSSQKWTL